MIMSLEGAVMIIPGDAGRVTAAWHNVTRDTWSRDPFLIVTSQNTPDSVIKITKQKKLRSCLSFNQWCQEIESESPDQIFINFGHIFSRVIFSLVVLMTKLTVMMMMMIFITILKMMTKPDLISDRSAWHILPWCVLKQRGMFLL